jgi:hypothetical protein
MNAEHSSIEASGDNTHPRHWRDAAGATSTPQQPRRIDVGFDAGGDGVAVERGMGLIGVVSLVDEHPDRPVDRRHVV